MKFKPMLADSVTDASKLRFPLFASKKFDGVRAMMQNGRLVSRTLKPIPNENVQELFKLLPEGIDGELGVTDPRDPEFYRRTVSVVMSSKKPAIDVKFYAFDSYGPENYDVRLHNLIKGLFDMARTAPAESCEGKLWKCIELVQQVKIYDNNELDQLEAAWLEEGYEGVMLRDPVGRYKEGRSSEREGILLKLKRFEDAEAEIISVYEQMHNANEAHTNALGRTERSTAKAGMEHTGVLGGFDVTGVGGVYDKIEFGIGGGFDAIMRKKYWAQRDKLVGMIVTYKYFKTGGKNRPRFPVFKGFRDKRDM